MPTSFSEPEHVDFVLRAEGLFCPIPVARATEKMAALSSGQVLEIRATDPGVIIDIPAWCHSGRHEFLGYRREQAVLVCWVRKG